MATLISHGTVPAWGIAQAEDSALLLTSLDITTTASGEYVQQNRFGQSAGIILYDQTASFSMSGALVNGGTLATTLAGAVTLNNFANNNDFVTGLGAGESNTDRTSVCKEIKRTLSNTAAVQIDITGTIYNFAPTPSA